MSNVTTKQIEEQKAFDAGLYVWISIALDKCPYVTMKMVTHSVPNFLEHYAKEMGFIDYKDATDFFKEVKDTYNKLGKVPLLELLETKESAMIMEILKG